MLFAMRRFLLLLLLATAWQDCFGQLNDDQSASSYEVVEFNVAGKHRTALGNVLVEAEDGGILLEARNQTIWPLQPDEILSRKPLEDTPGDLSRKELAAAIQDPSTTHRALDVRISRLRQKLGDNPKTPKMIRTVYGAGYIFVGTVDWRD